MLPQMKLTNIKACEASVNAGRCWNSPPARLQGLLVFEGCKKDTLK